MVMLQMLYGKTITESHCSHQHPATQYATPETPASYPSSSGSETAGNLGTGREVQLLNPCGIPWLAPSLSIQSSSESL